MNEIDIYTFLNKKYKKIRKNIKLSYVFIGIFGLYSILMVSLPLLKWVTLLTIILPLVFVIYYFFSSFLKEYKFAKKYTIFYNKWSNKESFVNNLSRKLSEPFSTDHIYLKDYAQEYIDERVKDHSDDLKKISSSIKNCILNTNLIEEINFYEKYKSFKSDMNKCRNL